MNPLLTPKELSVVRLMADGLDTKEIATRLNMRLTTIYVHLHNARVKYQVPSNFLLLMVIYLPELPKDSDNSNSVGDMIR